MAGRIRIGALVSGGGSNLQAIIDGCESNRIDADVVFVGSDNPEARGLNRAKKHGIPAFVVDYKAIKEQIQGQSLEGLIPKDFDLDNVLALHHVAPNTSDRDKLVRYFSTRAITEAALLKEMAPYPFDLLILAGFMKVLTAYFIDRVNTDPSSPRIMNIHPALLPSFPGLHGHKDAIDYGVKISGCTVHFVDEGMDTGPVIIQAAVPVSPDDTDADLSERILSLEHKIYPEAIQLFAEGRLEVQGRIVTIRGYVPPTDTLINPPINPD